IYVRTGPESPGSPWFDRGSADAAAILRGEWWRSVTALTLHADAGHVAGNAVLGGLLLALLARSVGPGVASVLMLLSGVGGTFAAATLIRHDFVSIGASTAVFGALGALAALPRESRRVWMPVIGGLALLALLGTSKRADVAGHVCGFVSGVVVGVAVARLPQLRSRAAQACLAVAAAAVPVAAWLAAFRLTLLRPPGWDPRQPAVTWPGTPMFHGTTILCVRRDGRVVLGGDGQVTLDKTVMKASARKVRRLGDGRVLAGFAGSTADAFTLFERFESKLQEYKHNL